MNREIPTEAQTSTHGVEHANQPRRRRRQSPTPRPSITVQRPTFLTPDEAADLLRTTRKAIYSMIERGQLAGVRKLGRRVLIHQGELLDSLDHKACTPSSEDRR